MRQYTIAMSVRTVCFVLAIFVPGWGHLIFGVAAMVLPYFAVVVANAGSPGSLDSRRPLSPLPALPVGKAETPGRTDI